MGRYDEFFPVSTHKNISTEIGQFVFSCRLLVRTAYNGFKRRSEPCPRTSIRVTASTGRRVSFHLTCYSRPSPDPGQEEKNGLFCNIYPDTGPATLQLQQWPVIDVLHCLDLSVGPPFLSPGAILSLRPSLYFTPMARNPLIASSGGSYH